jgi:proline racemase
MRWKRTIQLVDVHCEGEIGRLATGGVPNIPGNSIAEQLHYINHVDDSIRRFLCLEPRSGPLGSVNLLLPPRREGADAGFIILQADQAHAMSGSNAICVTTALLEMGIVDICYGGIFYAIADASAVGLEISKANARGLVEAGMALKETINRTMKVVHPEIPEISGVAYVMFRGEEPDGAVRTCTTMWPGRVDRSPCGTGSSANLATLYARGKVKVGDVLTSRSTIGTEFRVGLKEVTEIAGRPAIIPTISGRAWTFGLTQVALDPTDPTADGFAVTDVWGPEAGSIR